MNINQELSNIEQDIVRRYNLFKATQGTEKKYTNIEKDFEDIGKQLEQIRSICLSEKREKIYRKYNSILSLYITIKRRIEKSKKLNEDSKQNDSNGDNKSKQEKTYTCQDQSKIQIKKMNKDYDTDDNYNFTNPPPSINRYQISRIVNTSVGDALIRNEVFSYLINMEKMEQDEVYRSNIINRLLSKENINEAIENYGGNVADSLKGDLTNVSEYTIILARRQMERSYDFYREDDFRTIILPVGEIQLLEDNHAVNQYRYCSFSNQSLYTGYLYGNIDIVRMEKDEEYREAILEQLHRKESIYIGETDENLRLEEDERIKIMLQDIGIIRDYKEFLDFLDL